MKQLNVVPSLEYSRSLVRALSLVLLFIAISTLILDGGLTAQITLMAVLGFLGYIAIMVSLRPQAPTATDLWLLRWGFVPLWIVTQVGTRYAWAWMHRL